MNKSSSINKREIGKKYELAAENYMREKGYRILETNFYTRFGEIDIIAYKDKTFVFTEVKYRKNDRFGTALEAVDYRKQMHIIKSALCYLNYKGYGNYASNINIRFDVIGICNNKIEHIENAFGEN